MKTKAFKSYSDSGHGWLAVKVRLLVELGLESVISSCSYHKGMTVYLEEDCDAPKFIDAYKAKYGITYIEIINIDHGNISPIRSYPHYKPLSKYCGAHDFLSNCNGLTDDCTPF